MIKQKTTEAKAQIQPLRKPLKDKTLRLQNGGLRLVWSVKRDNYRVKSLFLDNRLTTVEKFIKIKMLGGKSNVRYFRQKRL